MKLQIKTLSPIHIGNGEKYNGLSYVSEKGLVILFDSGKVFENLTFKNTERFMKWIEQVTAEIEQLDTQRRKERNDQIKRDINQKFRDAQRKLSLKDFLENVVRNGGIKSRFNHNFLYSIEAKSQVYNNVDIECFVKQNNKPYIPGTEIKGAMRTALAFTLLQKDGCWDWLKKELDIFKKQFRGQLAQIPGQKGNRINDIKKILVKKMGELEEKLQSNLFRVKDGNDAKYDLLKQLCIGDTELKKPETCLFVSNLKVEGLNRNIQVFQEFCKRDQEFTCQGFKLDNNEIILNKLGFGQEQKWVVSDTKNLFKCCHEFTERLLVEEMDYFNKCNNQRIITKLKVIQQHNTPNTPVLRIGKNEGYLSLTVGLFVKDRDKDLYDNVLCHATKNTSYTGLFPKTRRIVNLENGDVDTCGWIKLSIV